LRKLYPGVYGTGGFFDAVNPKTGSVGHRYLVLDQSMILVAPVLIVFLLLQRLVQQGIATTGPKG